MAIEINLIYKYVLITILAVVSTYFFHEFGHWTTGEILGNNMAMTLNTSYPLNGEYFQNWHYMVISFVGPMITLTQATVFYLLLKQKPNKYLYPFLFTCFYLELLSGVMNFRNSNDLGRISESLGIGLFTLSIIFVLTHFFLVYNTSKRNNYGIKFNLITTLLIILFSSIWTLSNQVYKIRIF